MRSTFGQTKCTLQARFLFSNFTENLQFEEKKEYVEILSNVDLHVERSIRLYYALRLNYILVISYFLWLWAKDSICAAKLRI